MFILLPETLTLDYLTNEEEGQYLDRKRIRFVRQFRGLTQTELAENPGFQQMKMKEFAFHNMRTELEFHVKTC